MNERGWPSITITISDGAAGADDAEVVERQAAIGFALPVPDNGDDGDDYEDRDR